MSSPSPPSSAAVVRPWQQFVNTAALSLPISLSEATYRLSQNINFFFPNYALLTLLVFLLTLITRPLTLLFFLCIFSAWIYLLLARSIDDPFTVFGFDIDHKIVIAFLSLMTLVAIFWTHVWFKLFIGLIVAVAIVFVHAVLMAPEDSLENSPYGSLLNVVDTPSQGEYASV